MVSERREIRLIYPTIVLQFFVLSLFQQVNCLCIKVSIKFSFNCNQHSSNNSSFLQTRHSPTVPHRCPSPVPPVRLWFPGSSHGCDEDEVPLSEKGEVSPRTVAPLIECHSGRGNDLQLGMRPKDGTSQEGRGTWIFLCLFVLVVGFTLV